MTVNELAEALKEFHKNGCGKDEKDCPTCPLYIDVVDAEGNLACMCIALETYGEILCIAG